MRLYSTYVHKGTKGDMILKSFLFFSKLFFYFVALMLTMLLKVEFEFELALHIALTL